MKKKLKKEICKIWKIHLTCHSRVNGNPVEIKVCGFPIPDISGGMTREYYFEDLIKKTKKKIRRKRS